jgi:2-beta-glucuronyltransferase
VPRAAINSWHRRAENLHSYVWVPVLHPARLGKSVDAAIGGFLGWLYPRLLPGTIRDVAAKADLIVIESCAAIALFPLLKRLAPQAKFVYCASDRLEVVGMQPALAKILSATAPDYDLVRVPARSMTEDFGPRARVKFIPHGIDKQAFAPQVARPYPPGTKNAVAAGDMMFDHATLLSLVERFPHVTFHAFGRLAFGNTAHPNLVVHGEVPFEALVPYLVHADVGLAPYVCRPRLDYLAESSLKLLQYTYCRLPIVAPHFAAGGRSHVFGYDPGDSLSTATAFERALRCDRRTIDTEAVEDWNDVMARVLEPLGLKLMHGAAARAV